MSTDLSLAELEQKRKEASDAWEHSKLVTIPKQVLLEKGLDAFTEYPITDLIRKGVPLFLEQYKIRP